MTSTDTTIDTEAEETSASLSGTELIKLASRHLRGTLSEALAEDSSSFNEDDRGILKFHGIYQQDDRDQRVKRGDPREKAWQMMIRLAAPGGILTADQYLALDDLAEQYGNKSLRVTTRQSIQFHGVLKKNLKSLIAAINAVRLSTIAACGDVSRNVMATPAPINNEVHREVQRVAHEIALDLRPRTNAYSEIWLDGERVVDTRDSEPLYHDSYLPRKFKVGVAADTDNSVDLYTYDCGLIAISRGDKVIGYNLLAGGGFGLTHNKSTTFARIASTLAFVEPQNAVAVVRAVCEIFRDHGNRADRRHARLKYLIEQWGVAKFVEELRSRVPFDLLPPIEIPAPQQLDYLGVHSQQDGRFFAGVFVQSGRISDTEHCKMRTAFREIVEVLKPGVRLTPMQSVLFCDLSSEDVETLNGILNKYGVEPVESLSNTVRYSLACPGMPTCGLALSDSERALPSLLSELESKLHVLGLDGVQFTIRMTGCPNGCARPFNADIGLVGRRPGVYHLYVGGSLRGDRLADLFASDVKADQIVPTLLPLLERFSAERGHGEGLGDYYQRVIGNNTARRIITGSEKPTLVQLQLAGKV